MMVLGLFVLRLFVIPCFLITLFRYCCFSACFLFLEQKSPSILLESQLRAFPDQQVVSERLKFKKKKQKKKKIFFSFFFFPGDPLECVPAAAPLNCTGVPSCAEWTNSSTFGELPNPALASQSSVRLSGSSPNGSGKDMSSWFIGRGMEFISGQKPFANATITGAQLTIKV